MYSDTHINKGQMNIPAVLQSFGRFGSVFHLLKINKVMLLEMVCRHFFEAGS